MLGRIPSVDNLQCFLAAAEHLNFRRAAESVALTPAAFGQRIKQLEDELGVVLFRRTTRVVELTPQGHRMIEAARAAVSSVARCAEVVADTDAVPVTLTLATRYELGLSWLVPSLIAMRKQLPHITVDFYFGSGPDILEQLEIGRVDAAVTSAPMAHREWHAEYLHPEHYVFVGSPELLTENPFVEPEDARRHTLLDVNVNLPLTRYLTSAVGEMRFAETRLCGAGMAMRLLVLDGLGVAVLPRYMVERDLAENRLQEIVTDEPLLSDSFRLIYRQTSVFQSAIQHVAQFLRGRPLE
jgi:DNA-binding transcriptional LysR family regulator